MERMFWPGVAVVVVGLFMLVAGIGPLIIIPILVILAGGVIVVLSKKARQHSVS